MEPIKPRRWFRFRLRTLLITVTLISVPLGWVGWEIDQRRREKAVVAWIEEIGGQVYFVSGRNVFPGIPPNVFPGVPPTRPRSWWEKTKDNWFGERVQKVTLVGPQVSDLSSLVELKKLEMLRLMNTEVSDLSPLAELKNLRTLWLESAHVTEEQVEWLRRALPNCEIEHWVPPIPFKLATGPISASWRLDSSLRDQ